MLLLIGVKNDDRQVKQDDTTKAINLYQKFLEGKINAISDDGDVTLDDIFRFDDQSLLKYNKYVFYDINGDKIPELLTSQISDCIFIFTVEKGKLFVWHDMISYCKILNNGDALTTVLSDGPPHISYAYNIFDYNGNDKFNIEFEKYDSNEDGKYDKKDQYYFDEIRVSKQEWDSLTKRYLNIGTDKIQWKFYTENIGVQ